MVSRLRMTGPGSAALALALALAMPAHAKPGDGRRGRDKFDDESRARAGRRSGVSRVIVVMKPGTDTDGRKYGGRLRQRLDLVDSSAIEVPNSALAELENDPNVESIHFDRPVVAHLNRVA